MRTKPVKVVLAGCGGISAAWLASATKLKGVEIVGLVDINPQSALARKKEYGLSHAAVGSDLRSLLKARKPDVVFDCTPPEIHISVTLEALRQGCHVLGEKPLADNMDNARKMAAAAKKSGRIYAVMQNRRYDVRTRAFRKIIASGKIGRLTTLNSDFYIGAHFGGFRDKMKHVLLLDMAIHTFDMARVISGTDAVAVYCSEWNPIGSWFEHGASAVVIFEMSGGVIYTYRGSWCAEGLNTEWEGDWRAVGSKGSASWNGPDVFRAEAVKTKAGGFKFPLKQISVNVPKRGKPEGHAGAIRDFIDCVRFGRIPETVCTDNIKSLAMVFSAVESAECGKRVKIRI